MDDVLRIGVLDHAGTTVLKLSGDLDSYTSPRLAQYGKSWLKKSRRKLVVNLDDLDYIDSTGLGALVTMWFNAREQGISMVISCRSPRIHRVFELTGLLNLFTVVVSRDGSHARNPLASGMNALQTGTLGADKPLNQPI